MAKQAIKQKTDTSMNCSQGLWNCVKGRGRTTEQKQGGGRKQSCYFRLLMFDSQILRLPALKGVDKSVVLKKQ